MSYPIADIEGIGPAYAKKLATAGIKTTAGLLKYCCDKKGRKKISADTGVDEKMLLEWANRADLMRIKVVGEEFSDLLEHAGVDTIKELSKRTADKLAKKLAETNEGNKYSRATPSESMVAKWIEQAKGMEPIISH